MVVGGGIALVHALQSGASLASTPEAAAQAFFDAWKRGDAAALSAGLLPSQADVELTDRAAVAAALKLPQDVDLRSGLAVDGNAAPAAQALFPIVATKGHEAIHAWLAQCAAIHAAAAGQGVSADGVRDGQHQQRPLVALEDERRKVMDAYYQGAIPIDLLRSEQDRISGEAHDVERLLAAPTPRLTSGRRSWTAP